MNIHTANTHAESIRAHAHEHECRANQQIPVRLFRLFSFPMLHAFGAPPDRSSVLRNGCYANACAVDMSNDASRLLGMSARDEWSYHYCVNYVEKKKTIHVHIVLGRSVLSGQSRICLHGTEQQI